MFVNKSVISGNPKYYKVACTVKQACKPLLRNMTATIQKGNTFLTLTVRH